ncbi:hypothetical protein ILYODFUR_003773 [Ilyodon furcidens]|uniref:Uncharacterized protein n=1 Tax=Ilyodon furcidens TaxID=33524 RepID=A0ABV0SLI6_9TELE
MPNVELGAGTLTPQTVWALLPAFLTSSPPDTWEGKAFIRNPANPSAFLNLLKRGLLGSGVIFSCHTSLKTPQIKSACKCMEPRFSRTVPPDCRRCSKRRSV